MARELIAPLRGRIRRNRALRLACLTVGPIWRLSPRAAVAWSNALLGLVRPEYRLGGGPWRPMDVALPHFEVAQRGA